MRIDRSIVVIFFMLPGLTLGSPSYTAAAGGAPEIGLTNMHAAHLELKGKTVHLWGGITGSATDYSIAAEELTGNLSSKAGTGSTVFDHAVVTGSAAKHSQIMARVRSVAQGYATEIHADKAVYDIDPTGKTDGTIVFTGNVTMVSRNNALLAAPGTTTFERLRLVLGKGPEYPQIQGDGVDATFIPNRGSE